MSTDVVSRKTALDTGGMVSEKHRVEDLSEDLQRLARNRKERGVAILHQISNPGIYKRLTNFANIFVTPLAEKGFKKAGENAVGLIIQPRAKTWSDVTMRLLTNCSTVMNAWGHTALYVRIDGKIVRVIGFDPFKISRDVIISGSLVTTGRKKTHGHYNDDSGLFHNNTARTVEYAIDRDEALQVLAMMPNHGPAVRYPQSMQYYVGSAGDFLSKKASQGDTEAVVGNCINYAVRTIQETLGAELCGFNDKNDRVSVLDLGGEYNANQGRLVKQFGYIERKTKKSLVLRYKMNKRGEIDPVIGSMPKSVVIIKGLKHAYLLTSVARFTVPLMTSYVLPTSISSVLPSAPYLLQSGIGAKYDTMAAIGETFGELSNQYISPEHLAILYKALMLCSTAYLLYGGDNVEIVYGVWSMVWPYILEWLASGMA
jgi:hypothetical protein